MPEVVIDGKVVEVRRPRGPDEYRMISEAEADVWGILDRTEATSHHLLIAADRRGGLVLGAFERASGRVVGFCYGIPALTSDGRLYLYSHSTGVISEYRGRGLGYVLKLAQREYALGKGFELIAWTYDPIQPLNARFNVGKLGTIVRRFYADYYGEMRDSINHGMPTDRFEAEWWIRSELVRKKLSGELRSPSLDDVLRAGARAVTRVEVSGSVPVLAGYKLDSEDELVLVEIPSELEALRPYRDLLLRWRLCLREVFDHYLNERGYIVVELVSAAVGGVRRSYYVLWRESLNRVLSGELPWNYVR